MLKLGVTLLHVPGETPEEKLAGAARMGFGFVELPVFDWDEEYVLNPHVPGRAEAFSKAIAKQHLAVSALQCHLGVVSSDQAAEERNLLFTTRAIALAPEFDAPVVHLISDRMERRNLTPEDGRRLVGRLGELLEAARRHGVVLALEPCVNSMVYNTESALRLFSEIPELRINYDPSHFACIAEDPLPLVDALGDRIVHCHAKDGVPDGEGYEFTPVGMGRVDWEALIGHLEAAGYDGVISIEYEGHFFGFEADTEKGILADKRFLEGLVDRPSDLC